MMMVEKKERSSSWFRRWLGICGWCAEEKGRSALNVVAIEDGEHEGGSEKVKLMGFDGGRGGCRVLKVKRVVEGSS